MEYKTLGNLNYNGTLYKPGSKVLISDSSLAEQLVNEGIVSSLTNKPPSEEKKTKVKKSIVADSASNEIDLKNAEINLTTTQELLEV